MKKKVTIPERLERAGTIERAATNADERTVELSFSSETPVARWWGVEVLGHARGEMNDSWIGSGRAPMLVDHVARVDSQVGVVEKTWVADGKGRAVVRFGKSARAEEIFQRVKDGELSSISVGYSINAMRLVEENDGVGTYRATDWSPLEVSLVSVPADPAVGVGRERDQSAATRSISVETKDAQMTPEELAAKAAADARAAENARAATAAAAAAAVTETRAAAAINSDDILRAERTRIDEITKIGQRFNCADKAGIAISKGASVAEFRGLVLDMLGERAAPALTAATSIGLTEKEKQRFSFLRAMNALANPSNAAFRAAAAFEFECSGEAAKRAGKEASGIMVPTDVLRTDIRALSVGTATAGGNTVQTDLLAGNFIDLLRARMMVQRMGATVMNDLQGPIAIPRQTGGATAFWVAEAGAPTESDQAFDQVTLSPKTVGAFTDFSRRLLIQSSIDVEAFVRRDLATVLALAVDLAAINGSGSSNQPKGVINQAGIGSVAGGTNGAIPTWANIVALETAVASANADVNALGYFTNAKARGKLKVVDKGTGGFGNFIWGDNQPEPGMGMVNGYRAGVSNQVPSNLVKGTSGAVCSAILFGNWADLMVGYWSGLDLTVDPYSNSTTGTVRVVALQDVDVNIRHPESFAAMLDALTT